LRRRTALIFQCYLLFAIKTARESIINALITMQRKPRAEANPRAIAILREMTGRAACLAASFLRRVRLRISSRCCQSTHPEGIFTPAEPKRVSDIRVRP